MEEYYQLPVTSYQLPCTTWVYLKPIWKRRQEEKVYKIATRRMKLFCTMFLSLALFFYLCFESRVSNLKSQQERQRDTESSNDYSDFNPKFYRSSEHIPHLYTHTSIHYHTHKHIMYSRILLFAYSLFTSPKGKCLHT